MRAPDTLRTPQLGVVRVSERLRLVELASENGRSELPSSQDERFDDPQEQIVLSVRSEADRICADYRASLSELNRRIRDLDVAKRLRALKRAPTELSRQLRELSARVELGYLKATEEYAAVAAEYAGFRAAHRLEREPRYPCSKLAPVALLLSVAVAKAGLAVHVFGPDFESALRAAALVFVDVFVAFQLGRAIPWIAARPWSRRLAGAGAIAGFGAWSGGFNLLAQLAVTGDAHVLAGLGLALTASAALIGFYSDDRYPGYGRLHRKLARARNERDHWKSEYLEGAAALHEYHRARIDTAERGALEDVARLEESVEAKTRLLDEIRDFRRNFENAANALLRLYRDTNMGHRSTPPPAYFESTWRLHLPDHLVDEVDADLELLAEASRMASGAEHEAILARERAQKIYREFVDHPCRAAKSAASAEIPRTPPS